MTNAELIAALRRCSYTTVAGADREDGYCKPCAYYAEDSADVTCIDRMMIDAADALEASAEQPTVDAVSVVRCKECKYRGFHRNASCSDKNETIIDFPENSRCPLIPSAIIMPDEFFCAEGRK